MLTYLVQALRAYRVETEHQFGQVTRHELPLTQDAANEIERLAARVAELEKGLLVSFGADQAVTGLFSTLSWDRIKTLIEEDDPGYQVLAFRATPNGLRVNWERLPRKAA